MTQTKARKQQNASSELSKAITNDIVFFACYYITMGKCECIKTAVKLLDENERLRERIRLLQTIVKDYQHILIKLYSKK